jgi:hypothetical protein
MGKAMNSVVLYFGFSVLFLVAGYAGDIAVCYGLGLMFLGFGVASLVITIEARKRDAKAALREQRARQE